MNKNIIIRMLGNDLKSLHNQNQTYDNLEFTLKHEPTFKNTDKVFVLNRIVNIEKKNKIIELLNEYNIKYLDIPFDIDEFKLLKQKYPLKITNFKEFIKLNNNTQGLVLYYYNIYLVNNNGCRNFCIDYGKKNGYEWIFLLDSNNYLTQSLYDNIINNINEETEYISIPSKRLANHKLTNDIILSDNCDLLVNNLPIQEPQLFFKNTSKYIFNEKIPYGFSPKAEMLNALNIQGFWKNWRPFHIFNIKQRNYTNIKTQTLSSVIRLSPNCINNGKEKNHSNRINGLFLLILEINIKYL